MKCRGWIFITLFYLFIYFFVSQRLPDRRTSVYTIAVWSLTLTSPTPWWCGDGLFSTASTCSSRVSSSPLWPYSSSFCPLTPERRSHWVRNTHSSANLKLLEATGSTNQLFRAIIVPLVLFSSSCFTIFPHLAFFLFSEGPCLGWGCYLWLLFASGHTQTYGISLVWPHFSAEVKSSASSIVGSLYIAKLHTELTSSELLFEFSDELFHF